MSADPRLDRPHQQIHGHLRQPGVQIRGEYLIVARLAKDAAEPLELCPEPPGVRQVQDLRE